MDVEVINSPVVQIPLGAAITLIVAGLFYLMTSRDLNHKVDRLEHLVTLAALYLQRDGILKDVEIDENGKLKGYAQTIHVPALELKAEVPTPTVTRENPPAEHKGAEEEQDSR